MSQASDRNFDAVYSAVGKFQVNWSVFEYELYRLAKIIYANCKGDLLPARFPDGIAGKIKLVERALTKEPRLSAIATDGQALTKDIWRCLDLRHLMVHGSIVHIENCSTVTFLKPPQIGEGPLQRAECISVELSQIEKQAQEMEDRSFELGYFVAQFESALPNPPGSHSP